MSGNCLCLFLSMLTFNQGWNAARGREQAEKFMLCFKLVRRGARKISCTVSFVIRRLGANITAQTK